LGRLPLLHGPPARVFQVLLIGDVLDVPAPARTALGIDTWRWGIDIQPANLPGYRVADANRETMIAACGRRAVDVGNIALDILRQHGGEITAHIFHHLGGGNPDQRFHATADEGLPRVDVAPSSDL